MFGDQIDNHYIRECIDVAFDEYTQDEIDDIINAAVSGAISTANENLYTLHVSKVQVYRPREAAKQRKAVEQKEKQPVILDPNQFAMSLLGIKSQRALQIILDFAENNKGFLRKYTK